MSRFKNIGNLFLALISVFILTACGHVQKEPDTSKQEEIHQNQVDATSSASQKD